MFAHAGLLDLESVLLCGAVNESRSQMLTDYVEVDDQRTGSLDDRKQKPPSFFVLDPRRYVRHRGSFLLVDRVFLAKVRGTARKLV